MRPFTPDGSKDFGSIWERQQHPPATQKLAKPNALMFFHIPLYVLPQRPPTLCDRPYLIHSQESYETPDTDSRTGLPLDVGSSDLERPGSAKKNGGFFQNGLSHALETQHRGAGGIPEVKVVGNGHCHGKAVCSVSTRPLSNMVHSTLLVTDNCRRVKGVWLCFGGGG